MRTLFRWAVFFLLGLACWVAASRAHRAPRKLGAVVIDEAVMSALEESIKNFAPRDKAAVKKNILPLLTQRCGATMNGFGLRSPSEVITRPGVIIRPATDLHDHEHTDLGLVHERTRKELRDQFSSCRAQAGTVYPKRNGIQLTTDERPIIFLHVTAFWGESPWLGKLSLRDVLIHEFIHAGGQPPTPGWLFFRHDLSGYEHYEEIMEACR